MSLTAWLLVIISQLALVAGQIYLKRAMTRREQADSRGWITLLVIGITTMTVWFLLWLGAMARVQGDVHYGMIEMALGAEKAIVQDPGIAEGVNTYDGRLTYQAVADHQQRELPVDEQQDGLDAPDGHDLVGKLPVPLGIPALHELLVAVVSLGDRRRHVEEEGQDVQQV